MPTTKPQKSVNLTPEDHERAQRCVTILEAIYKEHGNAAGPVTIKGVIQHALRKLEAELTATE
jgi:hypothetical protein